MKTQTILASTVYGNNAFVRVDLTTDENDTPNGVQLVALAMEAKNGNGLVELDRHQVRELRNALTMLMQEFPTITYEEYETEA